MDAASSKAGSMGGNRAKTGSSGNNGSQKPASAAAGSDPNFNRVLSSKAIQIGHENGITA